MWRAFPAFIDIVDVVETDDLLVACLGSWGLVFGLEKGHTFCYKGICLDALA